MFADYDSSLAKWMNSFSQILNVHGVNDVRQREINTAEQLVPEPSSSEDELAIEKLRNLKSHGIDQIPAELFKAGVRQFTMRFIDLLFLLGIRRRNCLRSGRSRSLYLSIRRAITFCSNYRDISLLPTTYKLLSNILL